MAKILVVEDNKRHRRFIRDALRLEGYEVLEASSGKKALEILERETVDLVTLDQEMPEMTGLECYERMPEGTKVIFITRFPTDPGVVDLRRQGVRIVAKPLGYQDILEAVSATLAD
jgi:DNA-binding response OmpR family regulator